MFDIESVKPVILKRAFKKIELEVEKNEHPCKKTNHRVLPRKDILYSTKEKLGNLTNKINGQTME